MVRASADQAGVEIGDLVMAVADTPVAGLADMFLRIWALGPAGTGIPLTVSRDGDALKICVRSADCNEFLESPPLH